MPRLFVPRRGLLLTGTAALLARPALGQQHFPEKPLRIVVPFAPGGVSDILARAMGDAMTRVLGQPVVVENRSGAGGNLGAEYVARGAADGYTLLLGSPATIGIAKPLYGKLNYDPDSDFVPVGIMGAQANLLLTNPKAYPSLDSLLADARAKPGLLNLGSSGSGSLAHLTGEVFAKDAGVTLTHVPYRGSPPAIADLMAGQIQLIFDAVVTAMPLAQAGALRILGTATAARQDSLPDVPSLVALGFPNLDVPNWFGLFAPTATPAPILARLQQAMTAVTTSPDWAQQLRQRQSMPLSPTPGPDLDAFVTRERQRWAAAVKSSGATAG